MCYNIGTKRTNVFRGEGRKILKQNTKTNTADLKSESSVVFDPSDEEEKIELQLLNSIRNSSNQTAAMKIATSIILYALEHPQSFRQQFRDLPVE